MKTCSEALASHLKQDTTTITTCWRITRADGKVFCFTEHDKSFEYQGEWFTSVGGFNKSSIPSNATFGIDSMEVNGFLSTDTIEDEEMRNGAFDYAEVEIFLVNYMDLSMGDMALRYGHFGEVKTVPSGAFLVELRGLIQLLSVKIGETYTPECRAHVGDRRCKVQLIPLTRNSGQHYAVGDRVLVHTSPEFVDPIHIPIVEPGFEEVTPAWTRAANYDPLDRSMSLLSVEPFEGDWFYRIRGGWIRQTVPLVAGDLTEERIDTNDLTIDFQFAAIAIEHWTAPRFQVTWLRNNIFDEPTIAIRTDRHDFGAVHPAQTWRMHSRRLTIPPLARAARIEFSVYPFGDRMPPDLGIDNVAMKAEFPIPKFDYRVYGGVEYECIQAGVTDVVRSELFTATLGEEIEDGEVIWRCVKPKHMFLDQVEIDAENSSDLKVTSLDVPDNWIQWGVVEFLSGPNVGRAVEVSNWDNETKIMSLAMPLAKQTKAGDWFRVHTGCAKSRETCHAKFNNILNFRGEPDVPGIGDYFEIAKQKSGGKRGGGKK